MYKLTFHIPCYTFKNGELMPNGWQTVIERIATQISSFYVLDATGCYKGRMYAEKLLVVYGKPNLADIFLKEAQILEQECYAYEIDNEMIIARGK